MQRDNVIELAMHRQRTLAQGAGARSASAQQPGDETPQQPGDETPVQPGETPDTATDRDDGAWHSEQVVAESDTSTDRDEGASEPGTHTDAQEQEKQPQEAVTDTDEGASQAEKVAATSDTATNSDEGASHPEQVAIPSDSFNYAALMETAKAEAGALDDQAGPHGQLATSAIFGQEDSFPSSMFANLGTPTQVPNQALAAEQLPAQTSVTESPHPAAPEAESLGNAVPNINPVVHHDELAP
jgi:hypothetical protein